MSYHLEGDFRGLDVYIVGFALKKIQFKLSKLKFLNGLGYAIYVAAFDLDEESDDEKPNLQKAALAAAELDTKEFIPRPSTTPFSSVANIQGLNTLPLNLSEMSLATLQPFTLGINRQDSNAGYSFTLGLNRQDSNAAHSDIGMPMSDSPASSRARTNSHHSLVAQSDVIISPLLSDLNNVEDLEKESNESDKAIFGGSEVNKLSSVKSSPAPAMLYMPPTWEPSDSFSFPIAEIPVKVFVPDNLLMEHFTDIKHISDGSNANIYTAKLENEIVIIKMIKDTSQFDSIAVHEFEVEHGILVRLSHPNIIRLLGAGRHPRRFLVLEYLGGGTLNNILNQNQSKPGFGRLFRRPTFTYANLLSKLRDLSSAFECLHVRFHPLASIIHRDLKPDNVGFTDDGALKLFDFGLCTLVRKRSFDSEAYEMTGNTGSLRYMAPEVALRKPYNEKVDVYSFGIMAWQMARERLPFKGMDRDEFMKSVVTGNERPAIDKSWPIGFINLLNSCWHNDPLHRPSFTQINHELTRLIEDIDARRTGGHVFTPRGTAVASQGPWYSSKNRIL
eukprot:CAMPEP_0196764460 /NCGR_PEP_ID=MMETSP1095-20130614/6186_1 /TAXON_ID=96789 ORGANISM="Chromulina nebulosa, Strain UTEXLB2642" /NCGR_SAMPLE_ID=MMETSP1095 /ASSEMBLY_ACC=CAM_ASM_000446 /LENGTH=558 /DNA_ID=CAMNT_0042120113 /DNA_START=537 /DNA_END=2213 /DNA_ORIENTATION=-